MHILHPRQDCPAGYQWYVCVRENFRGCCGIDACNGGCPEDELYVSTAAEFEITPSTPTAEATTTVEDTTTVENPSPASPTVGLFRTTTESSLFETRSISNTASEQTPMVVPTTVTISPPGQSRTTITSYVVPDVSATTPDVAPSEQSEGLGTPVIAGIVVGGFFALTIMGLVFLWWTRKKKSENGSVEEAAEGTQENKSKPSASDTDIYSSSGLGSPPSELPSPTTQIAELPSDSTSGYPSTFSPSVLSSGTASASGIYELSSDVSALSTTARAGNPLSDVSSNTRASQGSRSTITQSTVPPGGGRYRRGEDGRSSELSALSGGSGVGRGWNVRGSSGSRIAHVMSWSTFETEREV